MPPNDSLPQPESPIDAAILGRLALLRCRTSTKLLRYAHHLALVMPDPSSQDALSRLASRAAQSLAPPPLPALQLLDQLIHQVPSRTISTLHPLLNQFLGGGWQPGTLYEVAGIPGIGKTELLYYTAASILLNSTSSIIWIDASFTFSPFRLAYYLTACQHQVNQNSLDSFDLSNLISRVLVTKCPDTDHFFAATSALHREYNHPSSASPFENASIVIVDSVHALLAPIIGDTTVKWLLLSKELATHLKSLARTLFIPIIVSNSATRWNGHNKPALGQVWQFFIDESIILYNDESEDLSPTNVRKLALHKAPLRTPPSPIEWPMI